MFFGIDIASIHETKTVELQYKQKNVLFIDSEPSFIKSQKKSLTEKNLHDNFFSFINIDEAFHFIEFHTREKNIRLHYIIMDEKAMADRFTHLIERLWGLNEFLNKPDIIIIADKNKTSSNNHIMHYPFVSLCMNKPFPATYIEFLITGKVT